MSESILVRWISDDDGWREGVLCCCISSGGFAWCGSVAMRDSLCRGEFGSAVIWDRTRNERAIVPLGKLRLIEPRCPKCDGEGWVDVTAVATTMRERCECQEVPNA